MRRCGPAAGLGGRCEASVMDRYQRETAGGVKGASPQRPLVGNHLAVVGQRARRDQLDGTF